MKTIGLVAAVLVLPAAVVAVRSRTSERAVPRAAAQVRSKGIAQVATRRPQCWAHQVGALQVHPINIDEPIILRN